MTRGGRSDESGRVALPNGVIHISQTANDAIEQWAFELSLDRLQFWQLPSGLQAFWTLAYYEGRDSRDREIRQLTDDRDRYYQRAFNPQTELKPAPASYAEMERRRGNPERANQYEAFLQQLYNDHFAGHHPTPDAEERTTE